LRADAAIASSVCSNYVRSELKIVALLNRLGREERGGTVLTERSGRSPARGQFPNSHPAVTGIGLGSNFKYLPDVDWVESAPAKERG